MYQLFKLLRKNFNTCNIAMNADANLVKTQIKKQLLSMIYHSEFLLTDSLPIDETGRKTCKGLFIPRVQAHLFRQYPDFIFCQTCISKRAFNTKFSNSLQSRTVIPVIIHIGAFCDMSDTMLLCNL